MFVADKMSSNPKTIPKETSVTAAKELMEAHQFRRLPVLEKDKLVGWITDDDLGRVAPSSATTLSVYEAKYLLAKLKIEDVMTKDIISVYSDEPIEEAALLMLNHKIGGLPVLDRAEKLVGVITETDIFKAFLAMSGVDRGDATRLTIKVADQVGVLAALGGLFARKELSIASIAVYEIADNEAKIILRVRGDEQEVANTREDIERLGVEVLSIHYLKGHK